MDIQNPTYKNFTLVHQLKRRIRIISPMLKNDQERGYILEILLKKRPEIKSIRTVFGIGSVAIQFDHEQLPKKNLLIMLDAVLGNIGQKSTATFNQQQEQEFSGPERDIHCAVEGLTCASCALLIEMMLKRDPRIKHASVNFSTETTTVRGYLNKDELFNKIELLGYNPR